MTFCFLVVEFMIKTMFKEVRYPSGKSWLTTRFILFWADVIFSFYTIPIQLSCPQLKSAPLVAKIFLLSSHRVTFLTPLDIKEAKIIRLGVSTVNMTKIFSPLGARI